MAVAMRENLACVPLHGLQVHGLTMEQTLQRIARFVQEGGTHHVVTLDASMCVMAQGDPELLRIVAQADLVTPDSAGVLWACRRAGNPLPERVSGVEIVERLCSLSSSTGLSLYFLGAAPGVAAAAAEKLATRHPGCRIVGTHHGYFAPHEEPQLLEAIRAARPDVLCVALGIPMQEKWIDRHRAALGVPVLIGVGGTFDVHSGRVRRAPRWMQQLNLEWLYRLWKNPRKIGKVLTLPRFVLMTLRRRA